MATSQLFPTDASKGFTFDQSSRPISLASVVFLESVPLFFKYRRQKLKTPFIPFAIIFVFPHLSRYKNLLNVFSSPRFIPALVPTISCCWRFSKTQTWSSSSFPEGSCWFYSAYKLKWDLQCSFSLLLANAKFTFYSSPPLALASLVTQRKSLQCGRPRLDPWVRKIPWRKK